MKIKESVSHYKYNRIVSKAICHIAWEKNGRHSVPTEILHVQRFDCSKSLQSRFIKSYKELFVKKNIKSSSILFFDKFYSCNNFEK